MKILSFVHVVKMFKIKDVHSIHKEYLRLFFFDFCVFLRQMRPTFTQLRI